ncbi:unnamed protein product [Brachionus calyciflorus]|uniref:WAPL domain-containing protein n=1 Tax=Brachionus calyciflorus TaxID=104777 RepID=A0A814JWS1_9BILA|nr:unnamed protein product [Brachionus calyciflorus]
MKKSIVTYNNIKLTKTTNPIANETIINETKQHNLTNSDSTQVNNKPKIVLKRTLNDKKSDKFSLNNSFDESDDDDFNVFDLNTKTSQLSIKKAKSDTSPSSTSSSSFSPSGQTPPKIPKLSPVKTKKIGLKLPESDDEIPKKIEVKQEIKKIALVLPESDEEPVKKPQVKEESKKVVDLQAKLKELDDDEDFDMDLDKIKKFKVIKKSITETAKSENLSTEKKIIIKNKIFNSKTRGNESEKKLKISQFNINFNENDVKTDEEEIEGEEEELDKKEVKSNLVKTNSLQSQTTKRELMPRLLSFDKDRIQDVDASVIMINLRNSRKAYECEELGEAQAFQDDFNYLLDGLNSKYKLSDRCLSSIKLAECCQSSEFRMNLRSSSSNGDSHVEKIFQLLNDSTDFKFSSLYFGYHETNCSKSKPIFIKQG